MHMMSILEKLRANQPFRNFLKLFDIFTNAFFITVVTIFYWASTSDIMYAHIFADHTFFMNVTIFIIANLIILPAYIFQDELQQVHDYFTKVSCRRCRVITEPEDIIPTVNLTASTSSSNDEQIVVEKSKCCYDLAFVYRFLYSYLISIGYVAQWVSYWGIVSYVLEDVKIWYFLGFSFVSMLAYRIVLNSTLEYFCLCVPYCLVRDTAFDSYCIQWREISWKNVILFNLFGQNKTRVGARAWRNLIFLQNQSLPRFK
jgi:hypothetical protein